MTAQNKARALEALALAQQDHQSVIDLTRGLARIPSRGGIDPYESVLDHLAGWLTAHNLTPRLLHDTNGSVVALTCEVRGAHPGPRWVLDACLDTAPFGDETAWTHPPTSAVIDDGWLHGRGSADSKSGAAIFSHIAARMATHASDLHGTLVLLFDVDEHTGNFGGAKNYFEGPDAATDVAGVMIGYPGLDHLIIGSRGVLRAQLHVHGIASHSGSRTATPNAIEKAAHLINLLSATDLPGSTEEFPQGAKLTVTAVEGGHGYSITPDLCTINVDIRTTPTFNATTANQLLENVVAEIDDGWRGSRVTQIHTETHWPAYALSDDSHLSTTILGAADWCGLSVKPKVAGPSNIGNYLALLGIPATAGFGVEYFGLHGTDERTRIDSIPIVHATYQTTLNMLTSE